MPHDIRYQHTYAIWTNRWKVVEIASYCCHGCISHSNLDTLKGRNCTRENGLLDSCGGAHLIGKRDQSSFICNHSLRGDIPQTDYKGQKSVWFDPGVPITESSMEQVIE